MKILFLFFSLIVYMNCYSQKDSTEKKDTIIKYWDIVQVEGVSKDALFLRAREWFNNAFKSSKDVIQIQDKENGELAGRGLFHSYLTTTYIITSESPMLINFKINIYVKDGKYKYEMTNFAPDMTAGNFPTTFSVLTSSTECPDHISMVRQKKMNSYWQEIKDHVKIKMDDLIAELKTAMATKSPTDF